MQPRIALLRLAVLAAITPTPLAFAADPDSLAQATQLEDTLVLGSAEEELKQAAGVSIITAEDIAKRPPANDIAEIVRRMPGVNLTGNSSSGSRGNNRQIDIRGMGPENTLILIDGRPVTSRNAVRYTRAGERDTRGDSNWVPADQVERIEVLRGPAAARYGSGAMGGVVNIITKRPTQQLGGSLSTFVNQPEDAAEGATRRATFGLSGPLTEALTFRVYGNLNKTDADDADINAGSLDNGGTLAAGREGVRNKDLDGLLSWMIDDRHSLDLEAGFSRQGNLYAGDVGTGSSSNAVVPGTLLNGYVGRETNTLYRQTYSATLHSHWSFGTSRLLAQYENTRNRRFDEGQTGSVDGVINTTNRQTSTYDSYLVQGQLDLPLELLFNQVLTLGAEWNRQELDDPATFDRDVGANAWYALPNSGTGRPTDMDATLMALFVEDNIELTPDWILTPGLRLDHHDQFGANWSPSLNTTYKLTADLTLKGGIARAFKAPNLYQLNPNYLYRSNGNGCAAGTTNGGGCYVLGNADLDPELSINKELGLSFTRDGWSAGLTFFRNDYDNKITSSNVVTGTVTNPGNPAQYAGILRWDNAQDAVVQGWEGNLGIPLLGEAGAILAWNTNFTYMQRNDDQDGNPLSIVPKYTINTMLDWQATAALSLSLTGTYYGRQEPRVFSPVTSTAVSTALQLADRAPYHLWSLGGRYEVNRQLTLGAGVTNLFDKRLYRQNGAGANTYNEPGRAFYASLTASF